MVGRLVRVHPAWRQRGYPASGVLPHQRGEHGPFERTLIIADEDSYVHYIEGCTAPTYTTNSLHSAVVELIAKPGARIRYSTIQNWSHNTYNLVTKRGVAHENATIEWVDGNLGSKPDHEIPCGVPGRRGRTR